jgi:integrase
VKSYTYTSAFAKDIEAFLAFKKSVGIESPSRNWHLLSFDKWCVEHHAKQFDKTTVEGWVNNRMSVTSNAHLSWMSHIRELGRFMRANGNVDAYILSDRYKAKFVRITPYLLSQEEIVDFFCATNVLHWNDTMQWQAKCFYGLMYSCGLRTCEVMRLRPCDINLKNKTIDILWSKGNRSRQLAITDEVANMINLCNMTTTSEFGTNRPYFFVSSSGNQLGNNTVAERFHRIWNTAGLPESKNGKTPRPYDFRHHFAYANIERWMREGVDVNAMIPYLARYMGHATFDSTYYYVHTSPDFLAGYSSLVANGSDVLPEVGFDA